ncbi:oxidoreductase [Aureimonas altamirensis]|uniref:Oxidoreductase n=1 Tax=Aureimonas altamirensis TaxID=370622 RepID=A0A0B1Q5D0_9HYPH|nr:Gfo/Idh/MocA family oxidoreductase [Aureimonas altamirensis]KHJ56068.1 oxidoreductase [Aureimonas altamirensis]
MNPPLRIGLVGAGWVTQHHLQGWKRIADDAQVVAIADPCAVRARERAHAFGIPAIFSDAGAMLAAGGLDAVDIAAPRAFHADLARLAASHGLPILCQKPLAPTLDEARRLIADIDGKVRLMVHENWRFRAYYRLAAEWLRAGRIGAVKAATLQLVTSGTVPDREGRYDALVRQPFLADEPRMLVAEVLIHHLDTLRMLLGPLTVAAAALSRSCEAIAGEDSAVIHLSTAEGRGVGIFASFAAHGAATHQSDRLLLLGERGTIPLDGSVLTLSGAEEDTVTFDPQATYSDSYAAAIGHFVDCLRSGAPFETSSNDNLETLQLVEDCYRMSGFEQQRQSAA